MARSSVEPDWFEAERDAFIDDYLRDHPDATEFEAALMWAIDTTETNPPKDYDNANV